MSTINLRDIPDVLHRTFKALCAKRGKSIREEIIRLITEELEKARKAGEM